MGFIQARFIQTKFVKALLPSLLLISLVTSGLWAQSEVYAEDVNRTISQNKAFAQTSEYKQFLEDQYDIRPADSATRGQFFQYIARILQLSTEQQNTQFPDLNPQSPYFSAASALFERGIIVGPAIEAERKLTQLEAIFIALKASGLKELAYTYTQEKIDNALAKLPINVPYTLPPKAAQELSLAVDLELIPAHYYDAFQANGIVTSDFTAQLLVNVLSHNGLYKNFIGYVSDLDINLNIYQAFKSHNIIQSEQLQKIVDTALKDDLVTGYNLKDHRFDARFDERLTIAYGHSDITHAIQLVGLLRSEGLNAKVQLEPKTSAFIYLKEWGEPGESELYQVVQIENGNYIEYAKEYDILFEFETSADKAKFQDIILKYAKKDNTDVDGLLFASWWQPLYYSHTELADYTIISNNKISSGYYYAQSFSLTENSAEITTGFKAIDPSLEIETYTFWVDEPFYRYLLGDSK